MAISSIGVGSGLDVENIVTQLVELEKAPIKTLELKAEQIQSKISVYGEIKSLADDLNSAARDLTLDRTWNTVKVSSSSSSVANATVTGTASAGSYNVFVEKLAQAQTSVTGAMTKDQQFGAEGVLNFTLTGQTSPISIDVLSTDTLTKLAANINKDEELSKSVLASVVVDELGNEKLMLRSRQTGLAGSFTVSLVPGDPNAQGALGSLALDTQQGQQAQDAQIKLNGVNVFSSTNTFANMVPGLSISVSEEGKSSLLTITEDKDAIKASIQKFVDAYNAMNTLLTESTKYTEETKAAGVLQGDGSTVSLLNSLRMLTQSVAANASGVFSRLSDAGIQMLQGGALSVNDAKLSTALGDMASLKSMFAVSADTLGQGGGLATNFKTFTDALLAGEGTLYTKTESLEAQLKRNADEQTRIEDRASTVEARLRAQYTALDVKMASLSSLSSYVEQMVTSWNKSKE